MQTTAGTVFNEHTADWEIGRQLFHESSQCFEEEIYTRITLKYKDRHKQQLLYSLANDFQWENEQARIRATAHFEVNQTLAETLVHIRLQHTSINNI